VTKRPARLIWLFALACIVPRADARAASSTLSAEATVKGQ